MLNVEEIFNELFMCHNKTKYLNRYTIAYIVIDSDMLILMIVCVILFFTVFRKKKDNKGDKNMY